MLNPSLLLTYVAENGDAWLSCNLAKCANLHTLTVGVYDMGDESRFLSQEARDLNKSRHINNTILMTSLLSGLPSSIKTVCLKLQSRVHLYGDWSICKTEIQSVQRYIQGFDWKKMGGLLSACSQLECVAIDFVGREEWPVWGFSKLDEFVENALTEGATSCGGDIRTSFSCLFVSHALKISQITGSFSEVRL